MMNHEENLKVKRLFVSLCVSVGDRCAECPKSSICFNHEAFHRLVVLLAMN